MAHPDKVHRDLDPSPSFLKDIDLPVERITWNQADEFCLRLAEITGRSYRQPSEAEWEYACRAGTVTPFNFGPTITSDLANYCGTGGAVCGDSYGKSIASDVYNGVKYQSGVYDQGTVGIFRATTTRPGRSHPTVSGYMTCTETCGNTVLTRGQRAMLAHRETAARMFPHQGTVHGSSAEDRGRTTRRSAALVTGTLSPRGRLAGRAG
jgi:hypothetical protein